MVLALDEVGGGVCGFSLPPPSLEAEEPWRVRGPHDADAVLIHQPGVDGGQSCSLGLSEKPVDTGSSNAQLLGHGGCPHAAAHQLPDLVRVDGSWAALRRQRQGNQKHWGADGDTTMPGGHDAETTLATRLIFRSFMAR